MGQRISADEGDDHLTANGITRTAARCVGTIRSLAKKMALASIVVLQNNFMG
jgi:hypothetical protein